MHILDGGEQLLGEYSHLVLATARHMRFGVGRSRADRRKQRLDERLIGAGKVDWTQRAVRHKVGG